MIRILQGDCRSVLPTLADGSVQCCVTSPPYFNLRSYLPDGHQDKAKEVGAEQTPDEYIAALVDVFREVRRVMHDTGTLWVNIGDSYVSSPTGSLGSQITSRVSKRSHNAALGRPDKSAHGKPKDLLMIPARVAIALQADGWWLRSDIIWHKPSAMPESVTDRPTSAHEHVFLLTKSAKYFYDSAAVAEVAVVPGGRKCGQKNDASRNDASSTGTVRGDGETRNLRNVWTIASSPFSGSHFATMPPELAERCIKAGTSERGACPTCRAPWARQTVSSTDTGRKPGTYKTGRIGGDSVAVKGRAGDVTSMTTGWSQSCQCPPAEPVPCVVLDPFSGAGTTAMTADRLQRHAIGIELNPAYAAMSTDRLTQDAGMFAELSV